MTQTRTASKLIAAFCFLGPSAGYADDLQMRETFLSGPTSWCARDFGVPVIVEMSGLRVHGTPQAAQKERTVLVRRGTTAKKVDVTPIAPDQILERAGNRERTIQVGRVRSMAPRITETEGLGLLSAKGELCLGVHSRDQGLVKWHIQDDNGKTIESGQGTSPSWWRFIWFSSFEHYPAAFRVGDRAFFVLQKPEITTTTDAFPDPAKAEQTQSN